MPGGYFVAVPVGRVSEAIAALRDAVTDGAIDGEISREQWWVLREGGRLADALPASESGAVAASAACPSIGPADVARRATRAPKPPGSLLPTDRPADRPGARRTGIRAIAARRYAAEMRPCVATRQSTIGPDVCGAITWTVDGCPDWPILSATLHTPGSVRQAWIGAPPPRRGPKHVAELGRDDDLAKRRRAVGPKPTARGGSSRAARRKAERWRSTPPSGDCDGSRRRERPLVPPAVPQAPAAFYRLRLSTM